MRKFIAVFLLTIVWWFVTVPAQAAVPAAPSLYYTTNGLDLSVQWTEVPGATSYTLYYAPHPFTGEGIGSFNMAAETRLDASLWEGAAYYVAVVAINSEGSSGLSNIQQFVTSTVIPSAPQLTYDPIGTSITISWDPSARATGYRLSFMPSAYTVPWEFMTLDMGGQTSFSYDHLQVGQTYTIAVQAFNSHGTSGYSNIETFTVPDPRPPRYVTVNGPSGVMLETPENDSHGRSNVSLLSGGTGENLVSPGESLASPVVKVSVAGGGVTENSVPSTLSIPVDPAYRSNPDKLIAKVKLSTGAILPVVGWYDAATGSYRLKMDDLKDGWQIALINNPLQVIYRGDSSGRLALSRVTSMDWVTYDWEAVVDNPALVTANEVAIIVDCLKKASIVYKDAGFRSPRLFVNPSLRRTVIIETNNSDEHGYGHEILPNEDSQEFDMAMMTKEEADKFGYIVVDIVNAKNTLSSDTNYSLDQILSHELFHAVQGGYDVRTNNNSNYSYYKDGTATPVGVTFERTGGITGPTVLTRNLTAAQQVAMLDRAIDSQGSIYSKQDFFAYLAKKYNSGSFSYLHNMFDTMHNLTASRPDMLDTDSYRVLRSAMRTSFRNKLQVSLAEAYFTFVEDRAYRHSEKAILRPADESLEEMTLDKSIFKTAYIDQLETYRSGADVWRTIDLIPLQSKFVQIELPYVAEEVKLPLKFKVTGGELGAEELKLLVFRDGTGAEPVEVTTIDEPTLVPIDNTTTSLTVLAMNGYINPNRSEISISIAKPEIVSVSPENPRPGDQITITGKLFGDAKVTDYSKLWLNGNLIEPTSWTDTEIRFTLPPMGQEGTQIQNTIFIENLAGFSNSIELPVTINAQSTVSVTYTGESVEYGSPGGSVISRANIRGTWNTALPLVYFHTRDYVNWGQVCGEICTAQISAFDAGNKMTPMDPANILAVRPISPITVNEISEGYTLVDGVLTLTRKCVKNGVITDPMAVVGASANMKRPAIKEYVLSLGVGGFGLVQLPDADKEVCQVWREATKTWEEEVSEYGFGVPHSNTFGGMDSRLVISNGAELEQYVANPQGSMTYDFTPTVEYISESTHSRTDFNVRLTINPEQ